MEDILSRVEGAGITDEDVITLCNEVLKAAGAFEIPPVDSRARALAVLNAFAVAIRAVHNLVLMETIGERHQ